MLRSLQNDVTHGTVTSSMLDYGRHAASWQFVGTGGTPFYDLAQLAESESDGLIGGALEALLLVDRRHRDVAIVSLTTVPEDSSLVVVTHDNHAIGRMGGEYLLGRGFAQFAFFGSDEELAGLPRLNGFGQIIEGAGRPCHTRLMSDRKNDDSPSDRELIRQWLAELPKPIAIMTVLDYMARLTVNAAVDLGLRVPDEVAVLGVNNHIWTSALAPLPVSSIQLDMRRLGHVAARKP